MVFVVIRLFDVERWVSGGDLHEFPIEVLPEFSGNDRMTVFGRKDNVIIAEVDRVTSSSILMWLVHALSVPQRRRLGMQELASSHGLTPGGIFAD